SVLSYGDHLALPSFPTRRSSDLVAAVPRLERLQLAVHSLLYGMHRSGARDRVVDQAAGGKLEFAASPVSDEGPHEPLARGYGVRSEEHTSELQSREKLVCRLVLE